MVDRRYRRVILQKMDELVKQDTESAGVSLKTDSRLNGALTTNGLSRSESDSLERLTKELASEPESYKSARALQALEAGDAETALALCDSFGPESDRFALPLSAPLIRGRALLSLGRIEEAAEEFHGLLRLEPECPAALKGLGDTYFAQNKEVIAFTYYERARELSGDYRALAERVRFAPARFQDEQLTTATKESSVVALEEIIVRESAADESHDKPADAPRSTLKLKRVAEKPEPVSETEPAKHKEPSAAGATPQVNTGNRPAPDIESPTVESHSRQETAPTRISERYDRVQRPAHYQTETMADLLLQQGYTEAALDILRVLAQRNPLPRLREKLAKAEARQKRSR